MSLRVRKGICALDYRNCRLGYVIGTIPMSNILDIGKMSPNTWKEYVYLNAMTSIWSIYEYMENIRLIICKSLLCENEVVHFLPLFLGTSLSMFVTVIRTDRFIALSSSHEHFCNAI